MNVIEVNMEQLDTIFTSALKDAAQQLTNMLGSEVVATDPILKEISFEDIPYIFGGSQKIVSGIYMEYHGDPKFIDSSVSFNGHLLLTFKIESAFEIAAILTKDLDVPLDKIGGMTDSIFGEIGNVFGTGFLTSLANMAGCKLLPSVPTVINYKASAILEYVKNRITNYEVPIVLIQTNLYSDKQTIEGKFMLIPENYKSFLYLFNKNK